MSSRSSTGPERTTKSSTRCCFSTEDQISEIKAKDFPWVFKRDGKAARVIATLEALAMLLTVRAFFPNAQGPTQITGGNGALLNKLMSSKYPLSALLMEFG